ncbi:MAG: ATP-binding protein [Burkholderiales bacterium]|nr:ATP-binding protein [Burkholderiales bacterium]
MTKRLAALRATLRARPDTEHEQAIIRVAVGAVLVAYMLPKVLLETGANAADLWFWAGVVVFFGGSVLIFWDILRRPGVSVARRLGGAVLDNFGVTCSMLLVGEHTAPFVLVYVWITLANGFRYGRRYLLFSLLLGVVGFVTVVATTPYWRENVAMGLGLLVGMVAISLYVLKLVGRMFEALERAEAANRAKRRFISVMSHEMRTPLNAIIGMADLLLDSSLSNDQAEMTRTVATSSRVMLGLVEDVLDFSKIEAGKLTISTVDLDLHGLINGVTRIITPQAEAKGLAFSASIMPDVPPLLRGDPHYLKQILINLLGNAVKFTERGSVTLRVARVSAPAEGGPVRLKFSVRDTGIGIAPEHQSRIFESFTQADERVTRRFGGTGLGTTISRQLVELMGGRIGVESAVGLGSDFWFELDLDMRAESEQDEGRPLEGARVLLVGLPAFHYDYVCSILTQWGATCVAAGTPEAGGGLVRAGASAGNPFRAALVYCGSGGGAERELAAFRRAAGTQSDSVILCAPRGAEVLDVLPPGCRTALALPIQRKQLHNALHAVTADESTEGVVFLHDYLRRRERARQYRVLLVDDTGSNRVVIAKILERGGHVVSAFEGADAALDALEDSDFDVAIFDRNMPGMSGVEAIKFLRVMQAGQRRMPVIMLSGDATTEAQAEAAAAGADLFLSKPVEPARLLDSVTRLCEGSGSDASPEAGPERAAKATRSSRQAAAAQVLNYETLGLLAGLGTTPEFMDKLVKVFLVETAALLEKIEAAVNAGRANDVRGYLHAMKGSGASLGAERLVQACDAMRAIGEADLRRRGASALLDMRADFALTRAALERYLENRVSSSG